MKPSDKKHTEKSFIADFEETTDGSGDLILNLPLELCEELGWTAGTLLSYTFENGSMFLNKTVDKKETI